jgi:signal transduction histidine kinase
MPRRFLFLFFGIGLVFVLQMGWWIIFFVNSVRDELKERHLRMLVSEGVFFLILIVFGLTLIYRVLRHEVLLKQQFKDFFAGFSHELKTPLAAMKLQTETLLSRELPPETRGKLLEHMLQDVERLELTIENILDVFRYEAGRLQMDRRPMDLDSWLESSLETLARPFEQQGLVLERDFASQAVVFIDERYFQNVLANLMQNAVRYARETPWLRVTARMVKGRAEMRFSDRGIGLDPREAQQIFEKFYRGDHANSLKHKGTGVGLFLSRQIVLAHGGAIHAESAGEGLGTTFVITLPARSNR